MRVASRSITTGDTLLTASLKARRRTTHFRWISWLCEDVTAYGCGCMRGKSRARGGGLGGRTRSGYAMGGARARTRAKKHLLRSPPSLIIYEHDLSSLACTTHGGAMVVRHVGMHSLRAIRDASDAVRVAIGWAHPWEGLDASSIRLRSAAHAASRHRVLLASLASEVPPLFSQSSPSR